MQDHSYPLWTGQSFWFDRKPGEPLDPKLREFVRFVLSKRGQEQVERDGKYLPIDAATAKEGRAKLN